MYSNIEVLAGYFHQDWDLTAPTPDGVLQVYFGDLGDGERDALTAELSDALTPPVDESGLLWHWLEVWRACYDPTDDGYTMTSWFQHVKSLVA